MDDVWELIESGRVAEAPAALEIASGNGDGEATHMLATFLARGAWISKDWQRALALLALAAEQGWAEAETELHLLGAPLDTDRLFASPEIQHLCESPRVRRIDGFLTPEICEWLIERARGRLKPAATLEPDETGERTRTLSDHRTNSAFVLPIIQGGVMMAVIAERIGRALDVAPEAFEAPQVFHYDTGQEYQLHIDYILGAPAQRIATFLIYLNDNFEAGETWFPIPDLRVKPARGGAVYFANVDLEGQPDPMSLHAGTAPTRGEKWLLSQWIRDQPYKFD